MSKKQVGKFILDRKVGKGSYAQVWVGHCDQSGEIVAIKVISRHTISETVQLRQEVSVLKRIDHKNIVKFRDLKKSVGHYYLILEYCAGGDLAKFIRSRGRLDEKLAQRFLQQLSEGLLVLHKLNFIHRDLKPQNILLTDTSDHTTLKIADFGFARSLGPADMAATVCGSPLYMAPEILRHEKYDAKADLWSLGTILYELLFGEPPFSGPNPMQLLATIESSSHRIELPEGNRLTRACISLLTRVLVRFPHDRMSPEAFFSHEFNLGGLNVAGSPDGIVSEHFRETSGDIQDLASGPGTPPTDKSGDVFCVFFARGGENSIQTGVCDFIRAQSKDEVDEICAEALGIASCAELTGTYSGTQYSLGILLRCVGTVANVSTEPHDGYESLRSSSSDAFALFVRACLFFENALDHETDISRISIIQKEMDTTLEFAAQLGNRLYGAGIDCHSRPLRWVYAYLLTLLDRCEDGCTRETALLLADALENELAKIPTPDNTELEEVKQQQERILTEIQDYLRMTPG